MNENNSFQRQKDPQQASNSATYEQCHFRQVFTVPQCHLLTENGNGMKLVY